MHRPPASFAHSSAAMRRRPVSPGCPRLGRSLSTERAGVRPSKGRKPSRARTCATAFKLLYFSFFYRWRDERLTYATL